MLTGPELHRQKMDDRPSSDETGDYTGQKSTLVHDVSRWNVSATAGYSHDNVYGSTTLGHNVTWGDDKQKSGTGALLLTAPGSRA